MKNCLFVLAIAFLQTIAFSQNGNTCADLINKSNDHYNNKDFTTALTIFNTAIKNKCNLSHIELYNGACIASLAKNQQLALNYLQSSVSKGYDDTVHISQDSDLDNIRNTSQYRNIIKSITQKFVTLKKELAKINFQSMGLAIPYVVNGKWGWLHRQTLQPLTKPIFDYTDFKTARGLYFIYGSKKYLYTTDLNVSPYKGEEMDNGMVMRYDGEPEIVNDSLQFRGFIANNGNVLKFSNRFTSVVLIKEPNETEALGVSTDHSGKKAIIREDGSAFKGFDFKFSEIDHFQGDSKKSYFIAKESDKKEFKIYNREGNIVFDKPINGYEYHYNYQRTPLKENIYIGYTNYFIVKIGAKENVFDKKLLKFCFPKNYQKIIMINGPTDGMDKSGSVGNQGINEVFFLVSEGSKTFYVDNKGKGYSLK